MFILIRGIEHFTVLQGVEAMAEQQKLDRDLRRQLDVREAELAFMTSGSFHGSTEAAAGSGFL